MLREGIPPLLCGWLILRPWIVETTGVGLWAKSGPETGFTGHNYHDVSNEYNGTLKEWHYHVTGWFNSFIRQERNLILMKDVTLQQYHSGRNATFFEASDRLTYMQGGRPNPHKSAFAALIGNQTVIPDPVFLRNVYTKTDYPWEITSLAGAAGRRQFVPGLLYTMRFFGWQDINDNSAPLDVTTFHRERATMRQRHNEMLFRGTVCYRNKQTGDYSILKEGTSHWKDITPACPSVGKLASSMGLASGSALAGYAHQNQAMITGRV